MTIDQKVLTKTISIAPYMYMYMYTEHRIYFQLPDNPTSVSENRNRPPTMDAAPGAYFYIVLVHIETCQCICTNTHGQTWSSGAHVVFLLELQPSYRYGSPSRPRTPRPWAQTQNETHSPWRAAAHQNETPWLSHQFAQKMGCAVQHQNLRTPWLRLQFARR